MKTTVEEIRTILRREIAEQLKPGDLLPNERELADRFEVSRNTVREVMIHLEALMLIEKTKRGARVRVPDFQVMFSELVPFFDTSPRTFTDVLNFRRLSETGAVPLMVCHVTDDHLATLAAANDRMMQALTVSDAARADYDFHLGLVDAAGNSVLSHMYRVLETPLRYYLEVGKSQNANTETAHRQHLRIVSALTARDPDALAEAMGSHFQHSSEVLTAWVSLRDMPGGPLSLWPVGHPQPQLNKSV
ncbi:FadR/GntR family transcriptional regulator [Acidimangrovimonas sediminis]|uniref:FadR/GntR family transcriptional regulator n=1 Tax=Acidimangrovimonas sediminis TaxID=2056283 RepID=UPI000C80C90A|nr:FadR/GntR family transcriptional regulator [Acidimangrovimonas sediminis]